MDKITKLLSSISKKDALRIAIVLEKIVKNTMSGLDVKKLKGSESIFRVRLGKYRVIYRKTISEIKVLEISKRDESTYKGY